METEVSLPHSKEPASCSYPAPEQSSLFSYPISWRSLLILSPYLHLGLPGNLFPSGVPTKTLYTPLLSSLRATCPVHLILLDWISRTVSGEEYSSLSFSFCSFLHSPFTSSSGISKGAPFDPNTSQKCYCSGFGTLWPALVFVKGIHRTAILLVVCFDLKVSALIQKSSTDLEKSRLLRRTVEWKRRLEKITLCKVS